MKNTKVALIGSTGMLGQSIKKLADCSQSKMKVIGIARQHSDINLDIINTNLLGQTLDTIKPDLIINAAAITDLNYCEENPSAAYMVNAYPVLFLANYCKLNNIKFCQISTDHFFSSPNYTLNDEKSQISLLNQYSASKYAGECFAQTNSNSLIIRTNIVGFRGLKAKQTFIEWVIDSLEQKKHITLFDDFYTSSIDTISFSKLLFKCIRLNICGTLNLASQSTVSKKDFIIQLAKTLGFKEFQWSIGSVKTLPGLKRPSNLSLDVSLATKLLGQNMPTLEEVLLSIKNQYEHS